MKKVTVLTTMKTILVVFNILTFYTVWAQDFSYHGVLGPSNWGEKYETCVGKHQSPINIDEHRVKNITYPPLQFIGFDLPRIATIYNNGHTVVLKVNGPKDAIVTGGPLRNKTYTFDQLHFHWGANDDEGSEVKINNQSFAMELHAVFHNTEYGSYENAMEYPDGLAVLAYFMKLGDQPEPSYAELVESLPHIETTSREQTIVDNHLLGSILMLNPHMIENYYAYNGSLTTPPCSEVVTWIDFKEAHKISRDQIAAFRRIRTKHGDVLTHNFRPVQPLEDRTVYQNIPGGNETQEYEEDEHHVDYDDDYQDDGHPSSQFVSRASGSIVALSLLIGLFR